MCGIAGIVDHEESIESGLLDSMLKMIVHRGPDDVGTYENRPFSIGMRRLSIIDLSGGSQPIANEDKSIWVVLNGEIYNYVELRNELEARGHRFRTASDTEVLVHLYEEYGDQFLHHLNGMYALAIWDTNTGRCLLARDPLGIKPLFWSFSKGRLVFASEMKCVTDHFSFAGELDRDAIAAYLHLGYIPRNRSAFTNIARLLPGHVLTFEAGRIPEVRGYWSLAAAFEQHVDLAEDELVEQAGSLLEDAIRIRLRSDVPVGTFLSGGIDSSAVTAIARDELSELDTFGVKFVDHHFDESEYARSVASYVSSTHHELTADPMAMLKNLELLTWHLDEPNWDPAMLPSYIVCKHAREHVKVALSGNGGDEVFAGYHWHMDAPPLNTPACWARKIVPTRIRKGIAASVHPLSRNISQALNRRLVPSNNVIGLAYWVDRADRQALSSIAPWAVERFDTTNWIGSIMDEVPYADWVNSRLYYDSTTYMTDQILNMVDRSSMAVSLEVRVPFLDKRLVELMAGVHGQKKIHGKKGKQILKRIMKGRLPEQIFDRRKLGFGLPLKRWIVSAPIKDLLNAIPSGGLADAGIIDGRAFRKYLANDQLLQHHDALLWSILMLEIWHAQFVGKDRRPSAAAV